MIYVCVCFLVEFYVSIWKFLLASLCVVINVNQKSFLPPWLLRKNQIIYENGETSTFEFTFFKQYIYCKNFSWAQIKNFSEIQKYKIEKGQTFKKIQPYKSKNTIYNYLKIYVKLRLQKIQKIYRKKAKSPQNLNLDFSPSCT